MTLKQSSWPLNGSSGPGTSYNNRFTFSPMPISGLPSILVSSSEFTLEKKVGDRESHVGIPKGQIVNARVLDVISGRQSLLLIDGKTYLARTFVPLQQGQDIRLLSSGTEGHPVLKLVDDPKGRIPEGVSALIKSWGNSGPFAYLGEVISKERQPAIHEFSSPPSIALARIRQLITGISLQSGNPSPQFLNDLIQGSGLLWEKKLFSILQSSGDFGSEMVKHLVEKDLKGLVMQLLSQDSSEVGEYIEGLKTFLGGLESLQLFTQYADEESGRYLLPLPVLMQGQLKFGQMLIDLGDRHKSEKESQSVVKVSFLLTLTQLGEMRADFSVFNQEISGVFYVTREEIKNFFDANMNELAEKLTAHGYSIRDIRCRLATEQDLSETTLFDKAIQGSHNGLLNLFI